ncbi:hypothetical protein Q7P36_008331 [Cladosporium allicinum]
MHLPIVLLVALALLIANAQSSPVKRSSPDSTQPQDADAVQVRSDDGDFSMSGVAERDFDIVSPPPKVIPRSGEEFSMSGLLPPPRRTLRSRTGDITSADGFSPVSPSPKTRPSQPRTKRRADVWTNLMNKLTRKSPTLLVARQSGGLTPYEQNGPSKYDTSEMEKLPQCYGGGTSTPWGSVNTTNSNPYKSCPQTGLTRYYDFTVAECDIRPDGVETRRAICINGQYPGPLLEANYGDTIQVKVTNKLRDEGTSMHWYGFLQTGTNQMDGVPGVTQCPIAPNATMTYAFRAELYGTAWYHTHYSSQYSSGASGPIVIYGPTGKNPDIDLGPVMLSDWYRNDYLTNVKGLMRPISEGRPINPLTNSNLINGNMRFPCSKTNLPCETASYSTFQFTSGKNHLLRLVNTGSNAVQNMIALGVGQRAGVIVYGSGKPEDKVWMRSNIVACSANDGQLTEAVISNFDPAPHPIHLHGHNMQILNSGFGPADETTIIRPENPQRRDVMIMPPGTDARPSYLVI